MSTSTLTPVSTRSRAPRGIRPTLTRWMARIALAGALLAIGVGAFPPGPSVTGATVALAAIAPED